MNYLQRAACSAPIVQGWSALVSAAARLISLRASAGRLRATDARTYAIAGRMTANFATRWSDSMAVYGHT